MTKQEMEEILDRYSLQTVCDVVYLNGYRIGFIDWLQTKNLTYVLFYSKKYEQSSLF